MSDARRITGALLTAAYLACAGSSGTAGKPATKIVALDGAPPAGCVALGEVKGDDYAETPSTEKARERAYAEAARLSATHMKVDPSKTGRPEAYTVVFTGTAYRCPATAAAQ